MKLATFSYPPMGAGADVGVVDTTRGEILNLSAASGRAPGFRSMLELIDGGEITLSNARAIVTAWPATCVLPLSDVGLLAPLPEPRQIRDGMFFEEHVLNASRRAAERLGLPPPPVPKIWYERPIYYLTSRFCVAGPEHTVVWPTHSKVMDFELEIACVIGKSGRDIPPERAMDHVFGFTIFNDFSARDTQALEMQGRLGPSKGKNFDGSNVFGPWIVTVDAIGNIENLEMEARVNGERWGGGNTANMYHKWPRVISFISGDETIYPGEIIGSGTVGTGCGLELGRQLQHGDVVELEIENIGVLRNRVVTA